MTSAQQLLRAMRPGRVYRRQDLETFSTAVDRNLATLVAGGVVRKMASGLYYRPRKNRFGETPPEDRELVRAFLKTDDFLLTSYNHYNQLGLGLTQVYNTYRVYNHKRSGAFQLGGKYFRFLQVPAFPRNLTKEFLLVDLLNNLRELPDDADLVLGNLASRLDEFDGESLLAQLERYGRPAARRALEQVRA